MKRTLILRGERPVSWNDSYAGQHWSRRRAEAQRVHQLVRAHLDPEDRPFENPVRITVTVHFDKQPLDSCNIPAKLYVDGLTATGEYDDGFRSWLIDDDMRYVTQTTCIPRLDPENPRVVIEVEEV